jgi:hypothetical protein
MILDFCSDTIVAMLKESCDSHMNGQLLGHNNIDGVLLLCRVNWHVTPVDRPYLAATRPQASRHPSQTTKGSSCSN